MTPTDMRCLWITISTEGAGLGPRKLGIAMGRFFTVLSKERLSNPYLRRASVSSIQPFSGVLGNPEEVVRLVSSIQIVFNTHTSGDFDGIDIFFEDFSSQGSTSVTGSLGGYVKVGNPYTGNPHKAEPEFRSISPTTEAACPRGRNFCM
ncbi:hypothetical protein F5X98DRAFT_380775 [Xylaria grammica]|nr:hypothetical protein F5X98DRAFT_380775 [Xylaria grammica]